MVWKIFKSLSLDFLSEDVHRIEFHTNAGRKVSLRLKRKHEKLFVELNVSFADESNSALLTTEEFSSLIREMNTMKIKIEENFR